MKIVNLASPEFFDEASGDLGKLIFLFPKIGCTSQIVGIHKHFNNLTVTNELLKN
jgi:hypothetical protein